MVSGIGQIDDTPSIAAEVTDDQIPEVGVVRKRFDEPMMSPR
jgi:hypothetical protein